MSDIYFIILSYLMCVLGIAGCFIPIIPGSIVSYCGLLLLLPTHHRPSLTAYIIWGLVACLAFFSDNIIPMLGAKTFKCSIWGIIGCLVGTIVGLCFSLVGVLVGPFIGAFLGELLSGHGLRGSAKSGLGAFLGYFVGLCIKMVSCVAMLGWVVFTVHF